MLTERYGLKVFATLAAVVILAGCSVLSPAAPTQDPALLQATLDMAKTQAAQTVVADLTQNAPVATNTLPVTETMPPTATLAPTSTQIPTATLVPTSIPTNTLPPTATRVVFTNTPAPTNTPISNVCTLSDVVPAFGEDMKPNAPFDAAWTIKNASSKTWASNDIDIRYAAGTKMHEGGDVRDMPQDVEADKTFRLVFDMVAPSTTGRHTETWVLTQSGVTLCTLSVTIDVIE